jgi:lipopolysaccharide transport system permease protein
LTQLPTSIEIGTVAQTSIVNQRVIVPHSGRDAFRDAILSLVRDFRQARLIAWQFFLRDTRADFRQSFFGYAWLLINPIANTVVWVFLNRHQVVRIDTGTAPYAVFVLSGTMLWTAFTLSLTGVLSIVGNSRTMLGKVNFPHESLVYSSFLKSGTEALTASLVLVPALIVYHVQVTMFSLLYPLALMVSILVGAFIGLALSPIGSLFSDVSRGVHLALRFGFFLAPVIFALPATGTARALMLLNPITPVLMSGRAWLLGSGETFPTAFGLIAVLSVLPTALGVVVYKVTLPYLIERLS